MYNFAGVLDLNASCDLSCTAAELKRLGQRAVANHYYGAVNLLPVNMIN